MIRHRDLCAWVVPTHHNMAATLADDNKPDACKSANAILP